LTKPEIDYVNITAAVIITISTIKHVIFQKGEELRMTPIK